MFIDTGDQLILDAINQNSISCSITLILDYCQLGVVLLGPKQEFDILLGDKILLNWKEIQWISLMESFSKKKENREGSMRYHKKMIEQDFSFRMKLNLIKLKKLTN